MLNISSVENDYQYALRVEEKLRGRIKVVPKGRRSKTIWQRLNQVQKMNQNVLIRREGHVEVSLRVLVIGVVKKDIELMSVHRRLVIGELLW